MSTELRNFLALTYEELEEKNLAVKEQRKNRVPAHQLQEDRIKYLTDEKRIKAVTVLFSDLEGRLHMLDYDKKFLIKSWDNLTFDGSSIRGFTAQRESDLRLGIDWAESATGTGSHLVDRHGLPSCGHGCGSTGGGFRSVSSKGQTRERAFRSRNNTHRSIRQTRTGKGPDRSPGRALFRCSVS